MSAPRFETDEERRAYADKLVGDKEAVDARNRDSSAQEIRAFVRDKPAKVFAYVRCVEDKPREVTTWVGDKLGTVVAFGRPYKCPAFGGFPSVRQSLTVQGINGALYFGTYYKSSGDYCRLNIKRVAP